VFVTNVVLYYHTEPQSGAYKVQRPVQTFNPESFNHSVIETFNH